MSELLHPTRLEWSGQRGMARHDGVQIDLHKPPGAAVAELHFTPGLQAEVRERDCDTKREMTGDEIRQAKNWLVNMARRAREATGQN